MSRPPLLGCTLACVVALASGAAYAATEVLQQSTHQATFGGKAITYTTLLERTRVTLENGPSADVVSTAYLDKGSSTDISRPVIFAFNGGPISPAIYLHFLALGPKRLQIPDDLSLDPKQFQVVENRYTVLDAADVVFYDPAGTGYSKPAEDSKASDFFTVDKDASEFAEFVAAWSAAHGRVNSPKYIFGESYGTLRAAVAARQLVERKQSVRLDGVFLMGQATNIIETFNRPANVLSYTVSLPTLAALGWYHGKVVPAGRKFEDFLNQVRDFARTEYLPALLKGQLIEKPELQRVSKRLEELTGLPAKRFEELQLRVSKPLYRAELLADKGLVLGGNDGRYAAPKPAAGGEAADVSNVFAPRLAEAFTDYLRNELHAPADLGEYVVRSPVPYKLDGWTYGYATPFGDWPYMEDIRVAMQKSPHLRLFIGNGYQDTLTTIGAAEHALAQSGWPRDRVTMRYYQGGHMAYTVGTSLEALMNDVRALLGVKQ